MQHMKALVITTDDGFGVFVITSHHGAATYVGFNSNADATKAKAKLEAIGPFLATRYPGYTTE